jgi:hypothetical protein
MIPSVFEVAITGKGESPVPVKLTVGPGLLFLGICLIVVLLLKLRG